MTLREFIEVAKSENVAIVIFSDTGEEANTHLHLIKYFSEETLNRDIDKVELKNNVVVITLKEFITHEIKERIIKAYKKLNGVEPTEEQIKDIYKAFKECGLL